MQSAKCDSAEVLEFLSLQLEKAVDGWNVALAGESVSITPAEAWLTVGRYHSDDDALDTASKIRPAYVDAGRAHFGLVTPEDLRALASALSAAAQRLEMLQSMITAGS